METALTFLCVKYGSNQRFDLLFVLKFVVPIDGTTPQNSIAVNTMNFRISSLSLTMNPLPSMNDRRLIKTRPTHTAYLI